MKKPPKRGSRQKTRPIRGESRQRSLPEALERLYEPAARAARLGDAGLIREVLEEIRLNWQGAIKRSSQEEKLLAQGMRFAIEGVLGIVLASAEADARYQLLHERYLALPLMHSLGLKARAFVQGADKREDHSLKELADGLGIPLLRIKGLLPEMQKCGLVSGSGRGAGQRFSITNIGVELLEAEKPGWQLLKPIPAPSLGGQG